MFSSLIWHKECLIGVCVLVAGWFKYVEAFLNISLFAKNNSCAVQLQLVWDKYQLWFSNWSNKFTMPTASRPVDYNLKLAGIVRAFFKQCMQKVAGVDGSKTDWSLASMRYQKYASCIQYIVLYINVFNWIAVGNFWPLAKHACY